MKLIEPEEVQKYIFLGGLISPETLFKELSPYAYIAVGPEIVSIHFHTEEDAQKAKQILENLNTQLITNLETKKNVLVVWPNYLKKNPLTTPERKYKLAYKVFSTLSKVAELYYNDETGEVYVDEITDYEFVKSIMDKYKQRAMVIVDEEREYTSITPVEFVPRKPKE